VFIFSDGGIFVFEAIPYNTLNVQPVTAANIISPIIIFLAKVTVHVEHEEGATPCCPTCCRESLGYDSRPHPGDQATCNVIVALCEQDMGPQRLGAVLSWAVRSRLVPINEVEKTILTLLRGC